MSERQSSGGAAVVLRATIDRAEGYGSYLAWSRDGKRWATMEGRQIQLAGDGVPTRAITVPGPAFDLAFGAGDRQILACPFAYDLQSGAWINLPSLDGGALEAGLADPPPPEQLALAAGAWSPDGETLTASVHYQPPRGIDVGDPYRGPRERLLLLKRDRALIAVLAEGSQELRAVAASDHLVAAGGAVVRVWDGKSGRKLADLTGHTVVARRIAFSTDGKHLAAGDAAGNITVWETATWRALAAWKAHEGDVLALAFHPRHPLLATGGQDGKLRLWALPATEKPALEESLNGWVQALAFSPSGDRLAATVRGAAPRFIVYAVGGPEVK